MNTYRSLHEIPSGFGRAIISVGNFDGVHLAHQHVLRQVIQRARSTGSQSVVVTFDPHPLRILRPEVAPKLITPQTVKEKLLAKAGIDVLLVIPFTRDFSRITAEDFAGKILAQKLQAKEVHEGENFHFGHKAEGNAWRLVDYGHQFGFAVQNYPVRNIRGEPASSSHIRELIAQGKVTRARQLLGRIFSISATPGRGRGYGHKYTVPTINLSRYDELVPGDGVYFTRTRVGEETFNSVTNVGNRPTFGDDLFAVETHLLGFHPLEVTAQTEVEISFLRWRRPEIKFPSVEALKEQIGKDVRWAERYFARQQSPRP